MSKFVEKQKKLYKSLKSCFCPALQTTVHFTSEGLNHLLYNRRRPRNPNERHYRAALISHIVEVIESSATSVKEIRCENPLVVIWSIKHKIKGQGIVKVVLKQEGAGSVKFLSTMATKKTKKPRA